MAPAPKRKVEEPSSEYYSETPPPAEAGQEEAKRAKERPAEPEADYGGTDDELSFVPQPKEAKEAKAKEPEPKQRLAEPEVKKKPKAPEKANRRKRERSPKSGQSSNRSWEKLPGTGSGWDGRPGHAMEKNGVWGPFRKVKPFRISELPAHTEKGAGSGGGGGKDERVSCPVCWAVKPRNTL